MIQTRKSKERGHFSFGWLETYHTFSFGDYDDPKYRGYRDLRVINEDFVQPGQGFPEHAHKNMEIITYIVAGALEHKDSMGTGSVIEPGDIQRMSAGSGVTHSEYNPSEKNATHLLQIWILPRGKDLPPGYEQKLVPETQKQNQLALIASPEGGDSAVKIYQDALLYASKLDAGKMLSYKLAQNRYAWIQVITGSLDVNRKILEAGDGAAIEKEALTVTALKDSHFLLFNLA